jgi:hypothetical protein
MTGGQVVFQTTAPPNTPITVYVWVANGQQLANAVADLVDSYGRPLPNPLTTDANGNLVFYALPGAYGLTFEVDDMTINQGIGVGLPVGAEQTFDAWGGPVE